MPDCGSALQTHQQQNNSKRYGYADWFAVKPVVVFAVYTNEYDAEQPQSPHYSTEIVDALERYVRTLTELAAHAEINQRENKYERTNGYAVHGLPVECINAVARGNVDKLHAAEDKREQEWKEHRKVSLWRNLQLNAAPAYKSAYNSKETANE